MSGAKGEWDSKKLALSKPSNMWAAGVPSGALCEITYNCYILVNDVGGSTI